MRPTDIAPQPAVPPPLPVPPLDPVPVDEVDLVRLVRPLVRPFTTSFGTQTHRELLLVRVRSGEHEGWGECATTAAPVYSEEFTAGAALVLREHLVPRLLHDPDGPATATVPQVGVGTLDRRLGGIRGHRMARAALETALIDAQLRRTGRSLAHHLGAITDRVPAGVSVGIPQGGVPALLDEVEGYLAAGYVRVKLKVEPGFDVAPVRAVRARFGPDLALQVDANAAYDPNDPDHVAALDELDRLGLTMLEQPFAAERLRDHARHAARWATPVCLDESVPDALVARDVVESGAAGVVNIKLGRVGGVLEAVRIRDVCRARGIPVWCGGMLESGVGRAANVALAAMDGFRFPGDVSASDRYWAEDLTEPFVLDDGHLVVPSGPGIGRAPRPELLADAEVERLHG